MTTNDKGGNPATTTAVHLAVTKREEFQV